MLRDELKPHTLTEIRRVEMLPGDSVRSENDIYQSRICAINTDDTIDITVPVFMDQSVDLERNTRYSFLFIKDQTMKTAQGVFLQRIRIDNVPMAKIRLVTPLRKIQRRDYYRLGCNIDTIFQIVRLLPSDIETPGIIQKVEDEIIDDDSWNAGTILDISGGGIKFISEAPIMDLPYCYFNFFLDMENEVKKVGVIGKILSRAPIPRSLSCTYRVQFKPEHSKAQDDILAFIYSKQRKIAKKETGL